MNASTATLTATVFLALASSSPARSAEESALTFAGGLLTLDIEERLRIESRWNNKDLDRTKHDVRDDTWMLNRFRLGLAIRPSSWMRIYAQTQDTREWFSSRGSIPGVNGAEGGDFFDLRQLYVEIGDVKQFPLALTVGRMPLNYGDNRLVADSKWGNFGRTYDGVKLRYETGRFWLDAFAVRPVQARKGEVNDSDSADNFFALYGGTDVPGFQTTEFYFIWRDKADTQPDLSPTNTLNPNGSYTGPAQRIGTLGTRWKSKQGALHGFDYSAEFAWQFGEIWAAGRGTKRLDQNAFALALTAGYTWEDAPWKPRVGIEYDYASGDKNPKDGSSQSFQNLLPSNHANYGFMDGFSWRNMHDARLSLSVKPRRDVEVTFDWHAFWLAETTDYWFTANGNTALRTTTGSGIRTGGDVRTIGAGNFAGHELDLTASWRVNSHLSLLAGYSHFFAGTYLRDTGTHDDADFAYMQATLAF